MLSKTVANNVSVHSNKVMEDKLKIYITEFDIDVVQGNCRRFTPNVLVRPAVGTVTSPSRNAFTQPLLGNFYSAFS